MYAFSFALSFKKRFTKSALKKGNEKKKKKKKPLIDIRVGIIWIYMKIMGLK